MLLLQMDKMLTPVVIRHLGLTAQEITHTLYQNKRPQVCDILVIHVISSYLVSFVWQC